MTRVLVLTPPRNTGYRDLALADSRARGESPVALKVGDAQSLRLAQRWIEVADAMAVYADFTLSDDVEGLIADAEMLGVDVQLRTLGSKPKPTLRERIAGVLA